MKAYSNDLRLRIVNAYKAGQGPMRDLAIDFGVGLSFVNDMIQKDHNTGSIEPIRYRPGPAPMVGEDLYPLLKSIVANANDDTLQEYCERLYQEAGIRVGVSTMCQLLQKLKLKRKKRSSRGRARYRKGKVVAN